MILNTDDNISTNRLTLMRVRREKKKKKVNLKTGIRDLKTANAHSVEKCKQSSKFRESFIVFLSQKTKMAMFPNEIINYGLNLPNGNSDTSRPRQFNVEVLSSTGVSKAWQNSFTFITIVSCVCTSITSITLSSPTAEIIRQ